MTQVNITMLVFLIGVWLLLTPTTSLGFLLRIRVAFLGYGNSGQTRIYKKIAVSDLIPLMYALVSSLGGGDGSEW